MLAAAAAALLFFFCATDNKGRQTKKREKVFLVILCINYINCYKATLKIYLIQTMKKLESL